MNATHRIVHRPSLDGRNFKVQENTVLGTNHVPRWRTIAAFTNLIAAQSAFQADTVTEDRAYNRQTDLEMVVHAFQRDNDLSDRCHYCGRPEAFEVHRKARAGGAR